MKLLYFARLREDMGCAEEMIELPPGVDTVEGLRAHLIARGGTWRRRSAPGAAVRVAVNQDLARPTRRSSRATRWRFFRP